MKFITLLLFQLLSTILISYSQNEPADLWANLCEFKTDGTGKALGLKIKFSVPCSWSPKDGERPHVVKNFNYPIDKITLLSQSISIHETANKLSKNDLISFYSQESLKEYGADMGEVISTRKIKIDGQDFGEIRLFAKKENAVQTIYMNMLIYVTIYQNKIVQIMYASGSANSDSSLSGIKKYETLIKGLVSSTVILSKWE